MQKMENKKLWKVTLSQLELKVPRSTFKTWLAQTALTSVRDGVAEIACRNDYTREWLETRYHRLIKNELSKVNEDDLDIVFTVRQQPRTEQEEIATPLFTYQEAKVKEVKDREDLKESAVRKAHLNPRYTFESFIVGDSNQLAHAAALGVAQKPGSIYNPLFLYGGVGLGKTHLMQAVGNFILSKDPGKRVLYCPQETFLNELIEAIKKSKTPEFRQKYRKVDVLMIDDIQFISKKETTQTEVFHTFNELHQSNKQIILASDRPPKEIPNLAERLRSRFEGGMVADVRSPEFETRVAILKKKAEERNIKLSDEILEIVATLVELNIRELEGALIKIGAFSSMSNRELTQADIERVLGLDVKSRREKIKPSTIIKLVCERFSILPRDIKGKRRTANVVIPRQLAMYLLREELKLPLEKVASYLNRSDHTTVLHALSKVEDRLESEKEFKKDVSEIKRALLTV